MDMLDIHLSDIPVHECGATGCKHSSHAPALTREAVMKLDALFLTGMANVSKEELGNALGLVPVDGETPTDESEDWISTEILMGAILVAFLLKAEKEIASPKLRQYFTGEGVAFDMAGLRGALVEVADDIRLRANDPESGLRSQVSKTLELAFAQGEARVASGLLTNIPNTQIVKEALTGSVIGYIGDYFERFAAPTIERRILDALATPMPEASLARPDLLPLGQIITDTFDAQGDAYARLVANSAVSRTYHYALTKAGLLQGYTTATFVAVLDNKTSDICESLAGRRWSLASIVQKYEAAAMATTTEELQTISPWYKPDKALGREGNVRAYLALVGVPIPPLHGHCRSTIRLS